MTRFTSGSTTFETGLTVRRALAEGAHLHSLLETSSLLSYVLRFFCGVAGETTATIVVAFLVFSVVTLAVVVLKAFGERENAVAIVAVDIFVFLVTVSLLMYAVDDIMNDGLSICRMQFRKTILRKAKKSVGSVRIN